MEESLVIGLCYELNAQEAEELGAFKEEALIESDIIDCYGFKDDDEDKKVQE